MLWSTALCEGVYSVLLLTSARVVSEQLPGGPGQVRPQGWSGYPCSPDSSVMPAVRFDYAHHVLLCLSKLWLEDWEDIDSDEELGCEDADAVDDTEEQDAEECPCQGAIPVTDCLFCPHHSSSLVKNVAHMTKVHSFFIPDIEYLSDLKGLIKYLGKPSMHSFFLRDTALLGSES